MTPIPVLYLQSLRRNFPALAAPWLTLGWDGSARGLAPRIDRLLPDTIVGRVNMDGDWIWLISDLVRNKLRRKGWK